MDNDGNALFNERIQNTHDDMRNAFSIFEEPKFIKNFKIIQFFTIVTN